MAASEPCARPKPAFVYMVRCTDGTLYTGWTTDPAARLQVHKSGRGARYTRARGAAAFAYVERCADKLSALRREDALKKLPKAQKELLCSEWSAAGGPFSGAYSDNDTRDSFRARRLTKGSRAFCFCGVNSFRVL